MINDFTGGGQIFLHKLRMFFQVLNRSCLTAFLVSFVILLVISYEPALRLDLKAAMTYQKAVIVDSFDSSTSTIRGSINPNSAGYYTTIDAYDKKGLYAKDIDPRKVIRSGYFRDAYSKFIDFLKIQLLMGIGIMLGVFLVIYLLWSRFGKDIKSEKKKEGSDKVLSALEVRKILKSANMASHFHIGRMPLVKDSETKHFLVTGSTGSGKTNLIHNILPQVIKAKQPAIIIDQTGEMIAKYYNKDREDIIFNPFDARGSCWDFWSDCSTDEELERFSKILFSFNRKKTGHSTDPFWEQSAETVFNAAVKLQRARGEYEIERLCRLVRNTSFKTLQTRLSGTEASRYLNSDNRITASSILSVLTTSTKPLSYLRDASTKTHEASTDKIRGLSDQSFSLKEYFQEIEQSQGQNQNSNSRWLFLSTKPSARELTLPLIACLSELAFSQLLDIGIKHDRRIWFVIDELSSLGKLPALSTLMTEGRKYGACVLSGLQSLNQLYSNYGRYEGSTIFGQFGTTFFFQNKEPEIAKMVGSICGTETIYRQQKSTSFGANEFRDGISYNEQQQQKDLVEYSDLASLRVGECIVLLPEPSVRIARLLTPEAKVVDRNAGFIQSATSANDQDYLTKERQEVIEIAEESESPERAEKKAEVPAEAREYVNTEVNRIHDQYDPGYLVQENADINSNGTINGKKINKQECDQELNLDKNSFSVIVSQ